MKNRWFLFVLILALPIVALPFFSCTGDDDDEEEEEEDDNPFQDDDDAGDDYVISPVNNEKPPWPEWPLRHWVWEDESTRDSAEALVADYLANDIPVGAIIIDSPWETGYNTFFWDPALFPDAQEMIDGFHSLDVRVFLWITANVNTDSPNFQEGLDNGYYVNNGKTLEWWKGDGAFIDYTNPDALAWWHGQMDQVLDMGIDGWKTDGSDFSLWLWGTAFDTYAGPMNAHDYQQLYYSDFFNYSRERLGEDRVITARPVDSYGIPIWGPTFAPRDVNFAGWVGDQDPTWGGLTAALINLFLSAERGYVNFGSDIGGYRGDEIREKDLFIRWAQLGAFCPIMENGGAGEHRPWMYDEETLTIYRYFVNLHHALIPYLYSQGATSYADGVSLMRPFDAGFNYFLGDWLYVSAINSASNTREILFPHGAWIDFWDGTEYEGDKLYEIEYALDRYPVFVRKGAILPLDLGEGSVFTQYDPALPPLTVCIFPNEDGASVFDVYEEFGSGARIRAWYGSSLSIALSATSRQYAFCINRENPPGMVELSSGERIAQQVDFDSLRTADSGWYHDPTEKRLWVKPGDGSKGLMIDVY